MERQRSVQCIFDGKVQQKLSEIRTNEGQEEAEKAAKPAASCACGQPFEA
jgi:hypothetical protein